MNFDDAKKIVKSECYAHNLLNLDRTLMINEALDTIIEHAERQSYEEWLQTFNTDSATECFTAVQELKRGLNNEQV